MSSHSLQIDKGSFLDGHNLTHGFAEPNWLHLRVPHMSQHAFLQISSNHSIFFSGLSLSFGITMDNGLSEIEVRLNYHC